MRVVALIHQEAACYGISFPDFPGCISGGEGLDETLAQGTEALNMHIASMLEDGDVIPVPRGLDDLRADPEFAVDFDGAVVATVPAFIPGRKTQRVNVSIDGDLLDEIDAAARTFPGGRSGFLPKRPKTRSPTLAEA
ncbi:MAG: type II toxin-antitoxin system HicB family antitoxin [Rhizobiaceae bacterium]|nr:type II toxin-antitoxin system HicB family antitoxin [Rhizobiaceae bacterium]